jgi:prepilin-type N-terminal cleavage/methylation domain-containing protein
MWLSLVIKKGKNQGFSLLETLGAIMILTILSSITLPSLFNWYNNNQVKAGVQIVATAFREVKNQAKVQGKSCNIIINSTQLTSNINGCLSSSKELPDKVTIATNITGTPPAVSFSYKGNPGGLSTDIGVIVVSLENYPNYQQCLLISDGLGMIRTGVYQGTTSPITAANCVAN